MKFITLLIIPLVIVLYIHEIFLDNITLSKNVTTIICGDSHTKSAVNDSLLQHSINISQTSEHFLYTYNVLAFTLKNNPQIKKVILGVSYHSFSEIYDSYVFDKNAGVMYSRYFSILNRQTISELFHENKKRVIFATPSIINSIRKTLVTKEISMYPFYGSFYKSKMSNLNENAVNETIKRHYYIDSNKLYKFSSSQKKYLAQITDLCSKKNVQLIFINTPISKQYREKTPKTFIEDYYQTVAKLKTKYDIKLLDYNSINLPASHYGDGDHLNYSGSLVISKLIRDTLLKD